MLPLEYYIKDIGPFTSLYKGRRYTVYFRRQVGFKQKFPYNIPTTYTSHESILLSGMTQVDSWSWDPSMGDASVEATNKARAKFVGKLGDASQWGSTLTSERRATFSTLVDIVTRAAVAARHIKRMEFLSAANVLGLPYNQRQIKRSIQKDEYVSRKNGLGKTRVRRRHYITQTVFSFGTSREYVKNIANGWLMYSYGVKPLMDDIYNSADIIQQPLDPKRVRAGATAKRSNVYKDGKSYRRYDQDVRVGCSANVAVANPNLWLANQVGLINPLQMINEGIPFSFVVDWFSNLSQFIQQMTDFVGLSVTEQSQTVIGSGFESLVSEYDFHTPYSKKIEAIRRTLSLPTVKLRFAYERFELRRGLNAISLLIGFLR